MRTVLPCRREALKTDIVRCCWVYARWEIFQEVLVECGTRLSSPNARSTVIYAGGGSGFDLIRCARETRPGIGVRSVGARGGEQRWRAFPLVLSLVSLPRHAAGNAGGQEVPGPSLSLRPGREAEWHAQRPAVGKFVEVVGGTAWHGR